MTGSNETMGFLAEGFRPCRAAPGNSSAIARGRRCRDRRTRGRGGAMQGGGKQPSRRYAGTAAAVRRPARGRRRSRRFGGCGAAGGVAHHGLRLGGKGNARCLAIDQAGSEHSGGADPRSGPGGSGPCGCCGHDRGSRIGLGVSHPGMALRRHGGAASRRRVLVFGASRDKKIAQMLASLLPHFDAVVFTAARSRRAAAAADLNAAGRPALSAAAIPAETIVPVSAALARAAELAGPSGEVIAAGSIFLLGDILRGLEQGAAAAFDTSHIETPSVR